MGFFKKTEQREIDFSALVTQLCGEYQISDVQALSIPSLTACVEYISSILSGIPIKLYREENGETVEVFDERVTLLNDDTGDLLHAFQMKKAQVRDYLLNGNGYVYINRENNKVKSLHYVENSYISAQKNCDPIFKRADFFVGGKPYRDFEFIKLLRNTSDGVTGTGVISANNIVLSVAYFSLIYELNLIKNGGNKKGFLQSEKRLTAEALSEIKRAWKDLYSNNRNNMMVLNDGIKFQESSSTSVELQLNEQKLTNGEEICKIFNLSNAIISGQADDDAQAAGVKAAILPIIKDYETSLNRDLLLESEKKNFYFAMDTTELLKGDVLKRYQAYRIGLQSNFIQPDEVRYKEDMPSLGLDFIKLGLNDVLYNPRTKEVYTPNTDKTTNISKNSLKTAENDDILSTRANFRHDKRGRFASGGARMSYKERGRVIHELNTYYTTFENKKIVKWDIRNHRYTFENHGFDCYYFTKKKKIK